MPINITLTGKSGPGITDTALAIGPVDSFTLDSVNNLIIINGQSYSIIAATTITVTKVAGQYTVVIS